jgi:hypothetical protein
MNALAGAGKATRIDDRYKAAEQIEIEHITVHSRFPRVNVLSFNF